MDQVSSSLFLTDHLVAGDPLGHTVIPQPTKSGSIDRLEVGRDPSHSPPLAFSLTGSHSVSLFLVSLEPPFSCRLGKVAQWHHAFIMLFFSRLVLYEYNM